MTYIHNVGIRGDYFKHCSVSQAPPVKYLPFPPAARLWSLVWVAVGESQSLDALLPAFSQVRTLLLIAGQGEAVLLAGGRDGVRVGLQTRPLVVWESHGEERLGVAHKLVDVPFPSHLKDGPIRGERN